jgi:hypothetical protein
MIVQETYLVEYLNRVIPLYIGRDKQTAVYRYYAQFGNTSEFDGAQIVEFEEINEETAQELIKNSSI